ncbi:uncharacterized protein TM35_000123320, partial [Trypanosoma theileri]
MTTMFVQLRRVVYLLVLLQCCVCVAYANNAESVTDPITHEESDLSLFLNEMIKDLYRQRDMFNDNLALLTTTQKNCSEALNRAENATTKVREVDKLLDTTRRTMHMSENVNEKESELKELLRKAKDTVKEGREAADNANSIATATMDLVSSMQSGTMELHSLAEFLKNIVDEHINDGGRKELLEEYQKKAKEVESSVDGVENILSSANEVAKKTEIQAEVASFEAKNLQAFIDEMFKKYPQIKEEVERESKETTQTSNNSTNTGSEGNKTPSPNENKESNGTVSTSQNKEEIKNPNTHSAQAEAGSHTTAQQQQNEQGSKGQNNKESKDETQDKNQNSQSNTPTDSNSSATGTSQSQNIPTNSSSSASIHLN